MALDPTDPNLEWAILGRQVQLLFAEPIGQYLVARSKADREDAAAELMRVDPTDARAVAAAQTKARVASTALTWLIEAVKAGEQAAEILDGESDG